MEKITVFLRKYKMDIMWLFLLVAVCYFAVGIIYNKGRIDGRHEKKCPVKVCGRAECTDLILKYTKR